MKPFLRNQLLPATPGACRTRLCSREHHSRHGAVPAMLSNTPRSRRSLAATPATSSARGRPGRVPTDLQDADMAEMAQEESPVAKPSCSSSKTNCNACCCRKELTTHATPSPGNPGRHRGDESALFAGDLARMYTRYAAKRGLEGREVVSEGPNWAATREIVLRIEGEQVYGRLRFESAATACSACRSPKRRAIHTSACTVAVMPNPMRRGHPAQPGRPAHRHLPRQRRGRPAHQQDRLGRARGCTCPPASWPNAGRPQPARQQGRCRCCRRASQEKERSERAAREAAERKGPDRQRRPQ